MLFSISKTNRKKYPYKIKFTDGRVIPLPSQYDFTDSSFIRRHGCIIAAFYMGLRFVGVKKIHEWLPEIFAGISPEGKAHQLLLETGLCSY